MAATREQLIAMIDKAAPMADQVTEQQRINAANRICQMIPAYGPSWICFCDCSLSPKGETLLTMSADQFRAFLNAKREFAAGARSADGKLLQAA